MLIWGGCLPPWANEYWSRQSLPCISKCWWTPFRPDEANVEDMAQACLKPVIFCFMQKPDHSFTYLHFSTSDPIFLPLLIYKIQWGADFHVKWLSLVLYFHSGFWILFLLFHNVDLLLLTFCHQGFLLRFVSVPSTWPLSLYP